MKLHQFKITCTRCGADVTFKKCRCDDKPKRKPLSDGTLPMTDSELKEFKTMLSNYIAGFFQITYQDKVKICQDKVCLVFEHDYTRDEHLIFVSEINAILYLAERYDLTEK